MNFHEVMPNDRLADEALSLIDLRCPSPPETFPHRAEAPFRNGLEVKNIVFTFGPHEGFNARRTVFSEEFSFKNEACEMGTLIFEDSQRSVREGHGQLAFVQGDFFNAPSHPCIKAQPMIDTPAVVAEDIDHTISADDQFPDIVVDDFQYRQHILFDFSITTRKGDSNTKVDCRNSGGHDCLRKSEGAHVAKFNI